VPREDVEKYGECAEFTTTMLKLANKLASSSVTREEYVLLKATILLNSGNYFIGNLLEKVINNLISAISGQMRVLFSGHLRILD
jgi:hypothetical protein